MKIDTYVKWSDRARDSMKRNYMFATIRKVKIETGNKYMKH